MAFRRGVCGPAAARVDGWRQGKWRVRRASTARGNVVDGLGASATTPGSGPAGVSSGQTSSSSSSPPPPPAAIQESTAAGTADWATVGTAAARVLGLSFRLMAGSAVTRTPPAAAASAGDSTAQKAAAARSDPNEPSSVPSAPAQDAGDIETLVEQPAAPVVAAGESGAQVAMGAEGGTGSGASKEMDARANERAVPASRLSRAYHFGSLAAGLTTGALSEFGRRTLGLQSSSVGFAGSSSSYLTPANAERVVATLCRVRGAALKLGQMISIQDSDFLPPELAAIFDRVRESADFMPRYQLDRQMEAQLGKDWRDLFAEFDYRPFAAASIGQVHRAVLASPDDPRLHGQVVAVKVQYPGVADSIDSDIDNLMMVLRMTGLVPKGLYVDNVLNSARRELAMECDYVREAACARRYAELVAGTAGVHVPAVFEACSGPRVLAAEMVSGVTLEQVETMDQHTRDAVAATVLGLTLRELFEWRFMQSDPNWGNFLYNPANRTLNLLDFGATMEYSREFIDEYIRIIQAAATSDRATCLDASVALGFLSGNEGRTMHDAHVAAVMALGRPFREDGAFDFGATDVIAEVKEQIPVMLKHREKAPPHESYSLHRKLSGAFLLCTRLRARVNCAQLFDAVSKGYPYPDRFPPIAEEIS